MKSMKAYMPILLLGLLTSMTGTLAAQNSQLSFAGGIWMLNPCNNHVFYVSGPTEINYSQAGTQPTLHLRFSGSGEDGSNEYRSTLEANFQFSGLAQSYDIPFHSVWVGRGSGHDFTLSGKVRVYMNEDESAPMGDQILADGIQLTCTK